MADRSSPTTPKKNNNEIRESVQKKIEALEAKICISAKNKNWKAVGVLLDRAKKDGNMPMNLNGRYDVSM